MHSIGRHGRSSGDSQILLLFGVNSLFGFAIGFSSLSVAPPIVFGLVSGLTSTASPAFGGWMWDNISPKAPFIPTLVLANAVGMIIWFKIEEKEDTRRTPRTGPE